MPSLIACNHGLQTIALYAGGQNGGVSCSSSAQGASADEGGQDSRAPDAKSPDAGSASGNDVLNYGIDGILSEIFA